MSKTQETNIFLFIGLLSLNFIAQINASFPYHGTKIGSLKRLHHGVSGDVYAVDSRTLFIKNFNYDGEAPAAYFYVGNTNKPSNEGGHRLRDERGSTAPLTRRYRNKDITLSLPESKTLRDIKWFSVWCDEFAVNFGDVSIPNNLDYPRPQKIAGLKGVHGVASDNIVIVDAQTLLVPNFSYDGEAPDAKFWVGRGQHPTSQGLRIPDENGKENPLRRYDRKTVVLTLPGDLSIFDIGHFGVWCEAFTVDFGHIRLPEGLNVPPSLKMLGISPQSKLNCEVLYDDLAYEVRWAVAGESIVIQLVAKLEKNDYMSFGISPSKEQSKMIGADVVVAWVEQDTGKGYAQDYYLESKSQCSGARGTCPDNNIESGSNSIRLLNAAMVNGYSIVTYQRSLKATDKYDLSISVNDSNAIVWAIGPLNERNEASFHTYYTKQTHKIDFGRQPTWNCPMPEGSKADSEENNGDQQQDNQQESENQASVSDSEPEYYNNRAQALQRPNPNRRQELATSNGGSGSRRTRPVPTPKPASTKDAWDIPPIQCNEPEDGVFYAQMGPTGGKHGYSAITGHVGWGISWYINGLLIPEIHVVRGKTYTFVTEGGNNPDIPAKYHPFYITDDPIGGYENKREEEKKAVRIFAGVQRSRLGLVTPTGVGRLCNWTPDADGPPADDYQSFGAYQRTLKLICEISEPGVITWTPDHNTPDTVYYQCFTHRYLGWKIHVHDSCDDARFSASERHEVHVPGKDATNEEDFEAQSSTRHETKVSPNDNFLLKHHTDLIKNHNMNGTPPKLTFEITKSSEITKLISDGIRAAEALEESIRVNSGKTNNNYINNRKQQPLGALVSSISQSNGATMPSKPFASTLPPEILQGELPHYHNKKKHQQQQYSNNNIHSSLQTQPSSHHKTKHTQNHFYQHHHNHHHHSKKNITNLPASSQKTIGLSEYLRPPLNAPVFHPVKLPGRRPFPGPIKKVQSSKPVLPQQLPRHHVKQQHPPGVLPQPSVLVNHYRKPISGLLKPFIKEKPYLIQPIAASVLLLGQPTELGNHRKTDSISHHSKTKPAITVPYKDLVPQDSQNNKVFTLKTNSKQKEKITHLTNKSQTFVLPENVRLTPTLPPILLPTNPSPPILSVLFKEPVEIHNRSEESLPIEIATMKPAVNNGFQPDSVIVESGFRPIIRLDNIAPPENVNQVAHRREDPGSEIDDVMETDTLFLTVQNDVQTQNFEPMFIPSPPDSTNSTIIIQKIVSQPPIYRHHISTSIRNSNMPYAAKLRNTTNEDDEKDAYDGIGIDDILQNDDDDDNYSGGATDMVIDNVNELDIKKIYNNNKQQKTKNKVEEDKIQIITPQKNFDDIFNDHLSLLDEFEDIDENFEDDDDDDKDNVAAQAAERIESFYLPPISEKQQKNSNDKIKNHISTSSDGAVVAYDDKLVSDNSLILPPKLDEEVDADENINSNGKQNRAGISHTEKLIRTTPKLLPFRGEKSTNLSSKPSTENSYSVTQKSETSTPISLSASSSSASSSASSSSSSTATERENVSVTPAQTSEVQVLQPFLTKLQKIQNLT